MKKFTAVILTFSLLFAFASCAEKNNITELTQSQYQETESTAPDTAAEEIQTVTESEAETELTDSALQTDGETGTTVMISALTSVVQTASSVIQTTAGNTAENTKATSTQKETKAATSAAGKKCTITITCIEAVNNPGKLTNAAKKEFIPSDGYILKKTEIEITEGMTVFDVLKQACKNGRCSADCKYCQAGGIQLEYNDNNAFGTYYIEGIHQIYEKDFGSKSGWMYRVNGINPNYGCSSYEVKDGDVIEFYYTVNYENEG